MIVSVRTYELAVEIAETTGVVCFLHTLSISGNGFSRKTQKKVDHDRFSTGSNYRKTLCRVRPQNCLDHILCNIVPILAKPAPIESPLWELSIGIGTGFVKIGAILRKLWAKQIVIFFLTFSLHLFWHYFSAKNDEKWLILCVFLPINFWQICFAHKILNFAPISMKPAPIKSHGWEVSIGAGFIKFGSILRKLWAKQIDIFFRLPLHPHSYLRKEGLWIFHVNVRASFYFC